MPPVNGIAVKLILKVVGREAEMTLVEVTVGDRGKIIRRILLATHQGWLPRPVKSNRRVPGKGIGGARYGEVRQLVRLQQHMLWDPKEGEMFEG